MLFRSHLALLFLGGHPLGPQIAAHELVHALEDDLAIAAFHEQHTLVAQHLGPVDLDDGAQEILELGRVEGTIRAEHKRLDVVVVVMVVRVVAMLAMLVIVVRMVMIVVMVMPVIVAMVVPMVILRGQEFRVDLELGVEVEPLEVEDF